MRLLELWGYGEMSAHTAQSLAAAAAAADLGDRNDKAAREIKSLASIGGHGKFGGNMQRDIINMYTTNMPDLYWAEIPIKDGENVVQVVPWPFVMPTDLFGAMHDNHPVKFKSIVVGGDGELESFWNAQQFDRDPRWGGSSVGVRFQENPALKSLVVPLWVHGDGVPLPPRKRDSVDVISFGSCMVERSRPGVKRSSLDTHFPLAVMPKHCVTTGTNLAVWKVLVWMLTWLLKGLHPDVDHMGRPWPPTDERRRLMQNMRCCGRYSFEVVQLRADMDYLANTYKLRHWARHDRMCPGCMANRFQFPWTDHASDAAWIATVYAANPWGDGQPPHPVFTVPGVCLGTVWWDVTHILNLGVLLHITANAIWYLVWRVPEFVNEGGTVERRLGRVWARINEAYRREGVKPQVRMSRKPWSHVCRSRMLVVPKGKAPEMKAKAAESRHLVTALASVFMELGELGSEGRAVRELLRRTELAYVIMERNGHTLRDADRETLQKCFGDMTVLYNLLSTTVGFGNRWHMTPKLHYTHHLRQMARWGANPAWGWTFSNEDYVGRVAKIAQTLRFGVGLRGVARGILEKILRGMWVRLTYE